MIIIKIYTFTIVWYSNYEKVEEGECWRGQVTFLVSASLLKERGAFIICKKENRFFLLNHKNKNVKHVLGKFHNFEMQGNVQILEKYQGIPFGAWLLSRGMKEPLMTFAVKRIVLSRSIFLCAIVSNMPFKQDHLRMNNSTRSNNHLRSIDLFRSMII